MNSDDFATIPRVELKRLRDGLDATADILEQTRRERDKALLKLDSCRALVLAWQRDEMSTGTLCVKMMELFDD